MVALFQVENDIKEKFLPPGFKPMTLFDAIFLVEYPDSTIGPYNENLILLSCTYNNKPGMYVFNIYVTSDIALAAGREIWGYPKKLCDIKVSDIKDNKVYGSLTRMGVKFLETEIELTDKPPGMSIKGLIENLPIYNVKMFPDVEDPTKMAYRRVTETQLGFGEMYKNFGAKTNYIKTEFSKFDICHELIKDAKKDLGGFYLESDMTLPPGKLLE